VDTLIVTLIEHRRGVIMLSFNKSPNYKSSATTLSDFRRIALSMPETEELNGMGYPNFRTGRRSFATIEDTMVVIRLTRDQQAIFVATAPEVFAPDSSGWGRLGNTVIRLEVADEATVKVAVATAWSNVAEVGSASEVVDVADVESENEFVNVAEVVEAGRAAEVADVGIGDAAEVSATVINVVNAGEFAGEVNAAGVAEVSASKVRNGAEVVETAAVSVEPRDQLPSVIPCQATNAGNQGERSMTLTLLAVVKRENMIDLKYGEAFDDPQPFVLTVTPDYVAHETAKSLPISASDVHAYILAHAAKLRATAENCKARDLTSEVANMGITMCNRTRMVWLARPGHAASVTEGFPIDRAGRRRRQR
jgi:hypothetical protein